MEMMRGSLGAVCAVAHNAVAHNAVAGLAGPQKPKWGGVEGLTVPKRGTLRLTSHRTAM